MRPFPLLSLMFFLLAYASSAAALTLESISHTKLPGDHLRVELKFSEPAPNPLSFSIANPARIALDFPNTRNGLTQRNYPVNIGATRSIVSAQANDRTRVVINLTRMVRYTTSTSGNSLVLDIAPSMSETETAAPVPAASATLEPPIAKTIPLASAEPSISTAAPRRESVASSSAAHTGGRSISNIDFRRGSDGAGRILIHLTDPNTPVDVKQQGTNIIVDLLNVAAPGHLQRRLDVLDFATPVESIDTRQSGANTQVIIKSQGDISQLAYQSESVYTIEVKPYTASQKRQKREKEITYSGEKLSLNFQDIEVRSVLQLIADFTSLNVVVSDSVQGNLTLRLKNVPWDQALDIIMRTKGLDKRQEGNVLLIAPAEEISARERTALETNQEVRELSPLRTEVIQLNYADAQETADLLQSQSGQGGGSQLNAIISKRGSVSIDRRTNTLLVQETAEKIEDIRALIQTLDVAVRQVMIESRIVTATDSFTREIGVNLQSQRNTSDLSTDFNVNFLPGTVASLSQVDAGNGLFTISRLGGSELSLTISAAEAEGRAEIVASPRLITSNKTKARIEQGVEIPFEEKTSSGATNIAFKKAVMSLDVTPHITKDDRINMELVVTRDSQGTPVNGIPTINTRRIDTQVLVNNGETIVLGGIFETAMINSKTGIPILSDLPVLGQLFRSNSKEDTKSELLIFVTPKIINENLELR